MGNVELVVLLPAVLDIPPALNAPRYADVKVKVSRVKVNRSGGRNGNGRCGRRRGVSKEKKDDNGRGGGGRVGGGGKRRRQQQR